MKKLILSAILCACSASIVLSQEPPANWQSVTFRVWKPTNNGNPFPKAPASTPEVYQDGHVLYFANVSTDQTLVLIDEYGTEAYSAFVASSVTTVTLPLTLSGEYELRLIPTGSSIYFYGYVLF